MRVPAASTMGPRHLILVPSSLTSHFHSRLPCILRLYASLPNPQLTQAKTSGVTAKPLAYMVSRPLDSRKRVKPLLCLNLCTSTHAKGAVLGPQAHHYDLKRLG